MTRSMKQLLNECDDLHVMLRDHPEEEAEQNLERRYKVVVMAVLPILLTRTRIIMTTACLFLGGLLALLFKALFKG